MKNPLTRRRFIVQSGRSAMGAAAGAVFSAGALRHARGSKKTKRNEKSKRKRSPPNILWIMFDDGRADALGCYGTPWAKTPHLDSIAENGVRFHNAIVQNPVCIPSRRSMATGFYSHEVGPVAMGKPLDTPGKYIDRAKMKALLKAPNLLDSFKRLGLKPVNAGKIHAFRRSWDHRGDRHGLINFFGNPRNQKLKKRYTQADSPEKYRTVNVKTHNWMIGGIVPFRPEETQTHRIGSLAVDTVEKLARSGSPFFLRVSFHAPHVPCRVPESYFIDPSQINLPLPTGEELESKPEFERKNLRIYAGGLDLSEDEIALARGTYYGMVSLVDAQVGRLLNLLKEKDLLENTVIVVNSDQGFQLGEHGLWKKRVFYEQNVRVPFIMSCPSLLPSSKVVHEPVEMIDFLPTLLDLCHLKTPDAIHGRSLLPLIRGEVDSWRSACFSEIDHSQSMYGELRRGTGRRVMVRTEEWKLVYFMDRRVKDKDGALYNLKKDQEEKNNLYREPGSKEVIENLERQASMWGGKDC